MAGYSEVQLRLLMYVRSICLLAFLSDYKIQALLACCCVCPGIDKAKL